MKNTLENILILSNKIQRLFQASSEGFDLVHGLQLRLMADHHEYSIFHRIKPTFSTVIHVPITLRKLKLQFLKYSVILQCLLMISQLDASVHPVHCKLSPTCDGCGCSWEDPGFRRECVHPSHEHKNHSSLCFAMRA